MLLSCQFLPGNTGAKTLQVSNFPLRIGNGDGKQGRGPHRRCGPDTEIQYRPLKLQNQQNSLQKGSPCDTDTIADAFIVDAVSETSISSRRSTWKVIFCSSRVWKRGGNGDCTGELVTECTSQRSPSTLSEPLSECHLRDDFWEGDEDSSFSGSESGGSLNGPDLFTELSLPDPSFTELPPPFSQKTPVLFTEKYFVASPSQKTGPNHHPLRAVGPVVPNCVAP